MHAFLYIEVNESHGSNLPLVSSLEYSFSVCVYCVLRYLDLPLIHTNSPWLFVPSNPGRQSEHLLMMTTERPRFCCTSVSHETENGWIRRFGLFGEFFSYSKTVTRAGDFLLSYSDNAASWFYAFATVRSLLDRRACVAMTGEWIPSRKRLIHELHMDPASIAWFDSGTRLVVDVRLPSSIRRSTYACVCVSFVPWSGAREREWSYIIHEPLRFPKSRRQNTTQELLGRRPLTTTTTTTTTMPYRLTFLDAGPPC
jgi:hypothetical protein